MNSNSLQAHLALQGWDFADAILKTRFAAAIDKAVSCYPVFRTLSFAAHIPLDECFDALALDLGWRAHRFDLSSLLLEKDGLFVTVRGYRKSDYSSARFSIWASTRELAEGASREFEALVGGRRITEPMFNIDWHFLTGRSELENVSIEELASDTVFDEAYPYLRESVSSFIARYLASPETIMVLQGPPGTGKTRLIRAILGAIARVNDGHASALYTGDKKTMDSDQIFVTFITGWHDAFVVEDADHLLRPRAEGNETLHRFLTIADGVVRSQGRKIIFSTNLPNVGDLDDALIRPGRCFAHVFTRDLSGPEAIALAAKIGSGYGSAPSVALAEGPFDAGNRYSVADVYRQAAKSLENRA